MINFAEKRRFMYRKKIPFDIDCGVKIAMEVIGGKWKTTERTGDSWHDTEKDFFGTSSPYRIFHYRAR